MSKILSKGLTFDDVLLVPAYSEVTPDVVDVTAWLTPSISLNIPLVSAAMDTVTESAMAISMAPAGGIGIVHKNMSIERQKLEIEKVKKSESGMIIDPITVEPDDTVEHALDLMHAYRVSGLPVVREKKLVGILTNRDVRFVEDLAGTKVRDVMTSENLITVPTGTTLEEAKHHLHTHRIEKLLVVDEKGELAGLLTMKDIDKVQKYPNACKDSQGRKARSAPPPSSPRALTCSCSTPRTATPRTFWMPCPPSRARSRIASSSRATWRPMKAPAPC